jgi:hypothetical protein
MRPLWRVEHGPEFDVPAEVSRLTVDCSWKNDVCPRFKPDEDSLRSLWCDHPDREKREFHHARRFSVTDDETGEELFSSETDYRGALDVLLGCAACERLTGNRYRGNCNH